MNFDSFEKKYQELCQGVRTHRIDLLTVRHSHPPGTDKETKRNNPIHVNPSSVTLVRGMGVLEDRVFGEERKPYTEDVAIMDMNVFLTVRGESSVLPGDTILCDYPVDTLKPGMVVAIGPYGDLAKAVIKISEKPHTACDRFAARFGKDAARWVNKNKDRNLRGVKAVILTSGVISVGDLL